ncbi:MAG: flagellar biosynthesis protein FlhF [Planctomycetota bacterium]|nr:flagellar biosynthesis protein FlhF [Planctomycetota bacterium]
MKLKTFTAGTMAQALADVKRDIGPHAVIIRTRVYKAGAVLGVGGRQVVEIIASDAMPQPNAAPAAAPATVRAAAPTTLRGPATPAPVGVIAADEFIPTRFAGGDVRPAPPLAPARPVRVDAPPPAEPARAPSPLPREDPDDLRSLRDDLASIKSMVGRVLAKDAGDFPALVGPGADLEALLIDEGLGHALAREVLEDARRSAGASAADARVLRAAVLKRLEALVPAVGRATPPGRQPDGRPLTIGLIGPTGVGKTTTIAKLAAWYKLRGGARVGLITCDTYRIAAVEQLRTYASIIAIPLRVALAPRDVADACDAMRDLDVIILDTPGRSQHDGDRLDELRRSVHAAQPHETHLVLSAGASERVLERARDAFAPLGADRLVVTKVDEAVQFAPIARLIRGANLRVSYITTGQEVPDQIELASSARMAAMMLDGPRGFAGGSMSGGR